MQKPPQRNFLGKVSFRHLLVLVYCLVLGLLVALTVVEKRRTSMPVSMTHATYEESLGPTALLALHGERMHDEVRILQAADMVDDRSLLLEILPGAPVRAVAVEEQLALVACFGNKLVSVDLSAPAGPTLLDSLELPAYIRHIIISGSRAQVGLSRGGGLAIVDVSDPEDLRLQAHYPAEGSIVDMVAVGDQVYFADIYRGVGKISTVGDNTPPEILDTLDSPWRIAVYGDRMVVASLHGSLTLFELARGGVINRLGTLKFPGLVKGGIRGLAFAAESLAVALSDGSMRIFPLSSWPSLRDYSSLAIPGVPYKMQNVPGQERLVISLVSAGVALVDLASPDKALVAGHLMLPTTILAMDSDGQAIYAARQSGRRGLVALDIAAIEESDFSPAIHVERFYNALYPWNGRLYGYRRDKTLNLMAEAEGTGFAAFDPLLPVHDEDGVSLFHMSENGAVHKAGSVLMKEGAQDAVFSNGTLYVLHRHGLRIMSDPQSPEMAVAGELEISGRPERLKLFKPGYLLVTTRMEGLKVIDISDRKHPVLVAQLGPPPHLQSLSVTQEVLLNGEFAYVTIGGGGVYVVDLDNPEHPELLQIIDTPGMARQMALHDDLLLVADGDAGVYMIDASRPGHLLPIGSLPTPLRVNEIATVADGILVSNYPGGTLKLPLPQSVENYRVVSGELLQSEAPASGAAGYVYLYDMRSRYRVPIEPPANESGN